MVKELKKKAYNVDKDGSKAKLDIHPFNAGWRAALEHFAHSIHGVPRKYYAFRASSFPPSALKPWTFESDTQ